MSCPRELQTPLLEILYWTMLEVRGRCQEERYCFALADHAHNIPHLIEKYSPQLLFYYWECERLCFIRELEVQGHEPRQPFQQEWDTIEPIHEKIRAATHIAPAIVMERDTGLVDVAETEEEITNALDPTRGISEFRVLDRDGTERILTLSDHGNYRCETKRADLDEVRRKLLMFGASCEVFDPTELQKAEYASQMFDAYLTQQAEQGGAGQAPTRSESK
jgi:hypothetical protein